MLSLGVDLDREVDKSYNFLENMDSGTVPRKKTVPVQVRSWNDRDPPRSLKSVKDQGTSYRSRQDVRHTNNDPSTSKYEMREQENHEIFHDRRSFWNAPLGSKPAKDNQSQEGIRNLTSDRSHKANSYQPREVENYLKTNSNRNERSVPISPKIVNDYAAPYQPQQDVRNENRNHRYGQVELEETFHNTGSRYDRYPSGSSNGYGTPHHSQDNRRDLSSHGNQMHNIKNQWDEASHPLRNGRPEQVHYQTPRNTHYQTSNQASRSEIPRPDYTMTEKDSVALKTAYHYLNNMDKMLEAEKSSLRSYKGSDHGVEYAQVLVPDPQSRNMRPNLQRESYQDEGVRRMQNVLREDKDYGHELMRPHSESIGRSLNGKNARVLRQSNIPMKPMNRALNSPQASKGSSLLERTNTYFDAVEAVKNRNIIVEEPVHGAEKIEQNRNMGIPVPPPRIPDDAKYHVLRVKGNKRMSMIEEPNRASFQPPPPPPPPMPIGDWEGSKVNTEPPWLAEVKAKKNLKRTPSLKRVEVPLEKEPTNFKEKLTRILQGQLAAQRWPQAKKGLSKKEHENEEAPVEASGAPYKTIKTLSKNAMKGKLEEILKEQQASFHGDSDMTEQRKVAIEKLRSIEKEALYRKWEEADHWDDDDIYGEELTPNMNRHGHPDEPVVNRQRQLMGDVVSTINLRGSRTQGSSFT